MTDVTDATFETDVLERSERGPRRRRPVGAVVRAVPARSARSSRRSSAPPSGKVELVKVNVDENPQVVARPSRCSRIPAVYALKDGAVVDGFIGAQGEAAVQAFVDGLLPTEDETEVAALLAAGDEASLRQALELEPDHERGRRRPGRAAGRRRAGPTRRSSCWPASPSRPRPAGWRPWPAPATPTPTATRSTAGSTACSTG